MRYAELSLMSKKIIQKAGDFSDPLRVDLENLVIDCDTEKKFLNSTLDCLKIILQDPKQYIENTDNGRSIKEKEFADSVSTLHTMVLQAIQDL